MKSQSCVLVPLTASLNFSLVHLPPLPRKLSKTHSLSRLLIIVPRTLHEDGLKPQPFKFELPLTASVPPFFQAFLRTLYLQLFPSPMDNPLPKTPDSSDFHSFNTLSVSLCSTIISGSDYSAPNASFSSNMSNLTVESPTNDKAVSDCEESESNCFDDNKFNSMSSYPSKPHRGNDIRWEAIRWAKAKDGDLNLGHFRLLKKLGFGDIGSVYLAELRGIRCLFAMKVMDKKMLIERRKMGRAQTERDILGLLDHPFLPTLYSHFETDKFSCLLMEFCSGGDLHTLRQRQPSKHFSEQAARFYASEVLLALEYLHMMGVVYRDLKPENVLVREDGHIMLSDFDLSLQCYVNPTLVQSNPASACSISAACKLPICVHPSSCLQPSCLKPITFLKSNKIKHDHKMISFSRSDSLPQLIAEPTSARSTSFVGTHEYLAPEIIRGDGHGSAVDWWTFGIFLYELLHGKTPFKGNGNRETLFNVIGQSLKFPEGNNISYAAKDLIRTLLEQDPQKRLGFKRGAAEIKQHPFFHGVNWALIRSSSPPEIPRPVHLPLLNLKLKSPSPLPSNDSKGASDSDSSSSSSYLEFEFF